MVELRTNSWEGDVTDRGRCRRDHRRPTCAGFTEPGDRLHAPIITETTTAVVVTFFADPFPGADGENTCPRPSGTTYTVHLSAPIGKRIIYDGITDPPEGKWPSVS